MNNASDYLENKILDHITGRTSYIMPGTVYVGLFTTNPTDANTGTEVSHASYTRESAAFNAAAAGATANTSDIVFGPAGVSWGTVSHIGVYDAVTSGNLLFHSALSLAKTITTGDEFKIAAGALTLTLG